MWRLAGANISCWRCYGSLRCFSLRSSVLYQAKAVKPSLVINSKILAEHCCPTISPYLIQKAFTKRWSITAFRALFSSNTQRSSSGQETGSESSDQKPKNERNIALIVLFGVVILTASISLTGSFYQTRASNQITISEFLSQIAPSGQIEQIIITGNNMARVLMKPGLPQNLPFPERGYAMFRPGIGWQKVYVMRVMDAKRLEAEVRAIESSLERSPDQWATITLLDTSMEGLFDIVLIALLLLALFGASKSLPSMKNSFQDAMGLKMKLNIINPGDKNQSKITFKDVAGLHEAKIEIKEFVDYLKNPGKYMKLGARLPKGALLTGPPGCGKTYLAKALAAESSVPFIVINGTEFVEIIGGLGASRIRNLFKTAKKIAPCIIYIDEVDAVGRKRGVGDAAGGGNHEEEQTLNQLLVEMDGIDSGRGIVILGSTNRPDILDKALLRPGRFDRHIIIDLPSASERQETFELYLKKIQLEYSPQHYSKRLAQMTPRFSGADISNIVNEAAIKAASLKKPKVTGAELEDALQRVLSGAEKRSRTIIEEEREIVAFHESGHALIGWLLEHTDALLKVSIIPRTSTKLGFAQYSPREKKFFNKEELFDRMCMLLGGRAAENVMFGRVTTGAEDDLQKVTKSAYAQVQKYGMCENIGPLSFRDHDDISDPRERPYSMKLQKMIDQEATKLISNAYFQAEEILKQNKQYLIKLADALLKKEVLSYEDVQQLIGPPKYPKTMVEMADHVLPDLNES